VWLAYARRARTWTRQHVFDQAEADYAAALKCGAPDDLIGWYRNRIFECLADKNWPVARWYADRAIAIASGDWHLYADRAEAMGKLDQPDAHDADVARAVEHGADGYFLITVADEEAAHGRWDTAARLCVEAGKRGHCDFRDWQRQALAMLKAGDRDNYRKLCAQVLQQEGATNLASVANNLAWVCSVSPDAINDYTHPVALAQAVVRAAQSAEAKIGALNTLGAILYRAGRYREAIEQLNEGIRLTQGPGAHLDWVFLAMAHHRLGESEQAHKYLARVGGPQPNSSSLWDRLEVEILQREARQLIEGKALAPEWKR
jgi:tetratricopeptide (TPR) repeat protein